MKVPSPLLKNLRKAMDQVVLDMVSVRRYLKSAAPMNGHELVVDAVVAGDVGARDILKLALASRVNRRTRRSLWTVDRMARVRAPARAGWYVDLCEGVYGLYRQLLVLGLPNTAPHPPTSPCWRHEPQTEAVPAQLWCGEGGDPLSGRSG